MSRFKHNSLIFICICVIFTLAGCSSEQSTFEKIYEVLEKVVVSEEEFEAQQDPLVELEKKEKELYDQIISLGTKEFEEITKLSDEALEIVDMRKKLMEKEEKSIKSSEKEFKTLEPLVEEIEEPKLKEKAKKLYDSMIERYKIHEQLNQHYTDALLLDKELYSMFKQRDIELIDLEQQIVKINKAYSEILQANIQFNEITKQYNDQKLSFYKDSGLNINLIEKTSKAAS